MAPRSTRDSRNAFCGDRDPSPASACRLGVSRRLRVDDAVAFRRRDARQDESLRAIVGAEAVFGASLDFAAKHLELALAATAGSTPVRQLDVVRLGDVEQRGLAV